MDSPDCKRENVGLHRNAMPVDLVAATVNPQTGLATDYLNHFNEAVMLLDLTPDVSDCMQDFLNWRPLSYVEHFAASRIAARTIAIDAYRDADPTIRDAFDAVTDDMTAIIVAIADAMRTVQNETSRAKLAEQAAGWLRPMVMQAGRLINGEVAPQGRSGIDAIMDHAL